jgi:hypothetical protein
VDIKNDLNFQLTNEAPISLFHLAIPPKSDFNRLVMTISSENQLFSEENNVMLELFDVQQSDYGFAVNFMIK